MAADIQEIDFDDLKDKHRKNRVFRSKNSRKNRFVEEDTRSRNQWKRQLEKMLEEEDDDEDF
jgi:hypothetical protein